MSTVLKLVPKDESVVTYSVKQIPIERIRAFDFQPRKWFDAGEISARAESMKLLGQQTPVTVEPLVGDPEHDYELIDGESRFRSAKEAGMSSLWAAVRSVPFGSKVEKHLAALVANFNRADHTPMEVSAALKVQTTEGGMSHAQVARSLGKSLSWVSLYLSLQNLHPDMQALMHPSVPKSKRLAAYTAFEIARCSQEIQVGLLRKVKNKDRAVVLLRSEVRRMLHGRDPEEEHRTIADSRTFEHFNSWTPEREARRRVHKAPNPEHVKHLRAGIAEFRKLLDR